MAGCAPEVSRTFFCSGGLVHCSIAVALCRKTSVMGFFERLPHASVDSSGACSAWCGVWQQWSPCHHLFFPDAAFSGRVAMNRNLGCISRWVGRVYPHGKRRAGEEMWAGLGTQAPREAWHGPPLQCTAPSSALETLAHSSDATWLP